MRESGILMPVSSLPGPYGIGCFGKKAEKFVDFLAVAGQKIWQILPLSPTGYGDSPYQSCSAFAGNPYFIDLDALKAEGLLTAAQLKAEPWGKDPLNVDYGTLYTSRYKILRAVQETLTFDERLQAAKSLIDECLAEWTQGARSEIRALPASG